MNLRNLKIFKTVCEIGNMSKAAEKLYMTQPAVSQSIAKLEEEFQIKLFERLNKKLVLTHAGKTLYKYSQQILLLVDEAQNNLEDLANMKHGKLRIGASMTIGTYLLPAILEKFNQQHSQIKLNFIIDNTSVIEEKILNNSIDIGLVEGPISSSQIEISPFYKDQLFPICAADHPWAQVNSISSAQLEKENLIMREQGSGTREVIENTLDTYNLNYTITHVLNNIEAIKKALKADLGITILPEIAVRNELEEHTLVKVNLTDIEFTREFKIIHHTDKYKSQLFQEFVNHLQQQAELI